MILLFEESIILMAFSLVQKGLFSEEAYKPGIMHVLQYVRIIYQINWYSYLKRTHLLLPLILSYEEGDLRKVLGLWKTLLVSRPLQLVYH